MPRTGENIYKRKDGRWEGRYIKARTPSGKAIYGYLYAKTYRDLKIKMSEISSVSPEKKQSALVTIREISEEWLVSKQPQIKESTYNRYFYLLNNYILPEIGEKEVMALEYDQLDIFCRKLLKEGGKKRVGLSPKMVSDILSIVRNIIQYTTDKGMAPPCSGKSIRIKQQPKITRILSKTEQEQLLHYLIHSTNLKDLGILLCLTTGLRIGEICALKWSDISLEEKTLFIHQTLERVQNTKEGGMPKTKILISTPKSPCSIRLIPLPDEVIPILIKNRRSPESFVLTGTSEKYAEPRIMQYHFKKVLEICDINDANFHSLRHTFATRCVEVGFDVKSLSEILGHASVNITMDRYVHPTLDTKRENMNLLSSLFAVN